VDQEQERLRGGPLHSTSKSINVRRGLSFFHRQWQLEEVRSAKEKKKKKGEGGCQK